MSENNRRPVQEPPPLSTWKVAEEIHPRSTKIKGATVTVSLVLVLAVVLIAGISSKKPVTQSADTLIPSTQAIPTLLYTQPPIDAAVLPNPPAFGLPSFQNEEFSAILAVKIRGDLLLEVQSPISGLTQEELGYEVYDKAQEFILTVSKLGSVDESGRQQVITEMNEIASWYKTSGLDPIVEQYRKSLWNSYRDNTLRTEVSWDNLWWLSNYLTAMGMLSNTPQEYQETEQLSEVIAEDLRKQKEIPVPEVSPLPIVSPVPEQIEQPVPETVPTPIPMRSFVPQAPINLGDAPENSIFELDLLETNLSQNMPGIPLNSEGFGLGWSLDSSIRSIQQLWEFLHTGNTGPQETWVVYAVNGVPVGEATIYNIFFFRKDTLQQIWNELPLECSSLLGKRMSGELVPENDAAVGRVACLSYLYGFEHPDDQFLAGRHYGSDGRIDYMATIWVGITRPPWNEGQYLNVSGMFDFLKNW